MQDEGSWEFSLLSILQLLQASFVGRLYEENKRLIDQLVIRVFKCSSPASSLVISSLRATPLILLPFKFSPLFRPFFAINPFSTMSSSNCTEIGPNCPADGSSLSYQPNLIVNIVFAAIFGISFIVHVIIGWKTRTISFLIAFLLGSSSETVGYIGRIILHNNPYKLSK
jgi:hypothetical protein